MVGISHTMGQDRAGSRKLNPPEAIYVSRSDLQALAAEYGFALKREPFGRAWFWRRSAADEWLLAGMTNWIAKQTLLQAAGKQ